MKRFLYSLLLVVFVSGLLVAQDTGSITGAVRDSSGAVVANAEVTVTNASQGFTRTSVSNEDGEYLVAGLPAGTYVLTVTAAGFDKYEVTNVILRVAQKERLDAKLKVAKVGTSVDVIEASSAQVETQDNTVGATITGKELTQLQLNGRNYTQLITLSPGVSNQTNQDEGSYGLNQNVSFSVNGGRSEYNNWELDGGDLLDNGSNTSINITPNIEAIAEVKVLTSNYGAQYGRNASGTVEAVTKSGTNSLHGEAFEFLRNDAFNARNYFNTSVAEYKKNDFGFLLGGPVVKNKLFFFWAEEWRKDVVPGQSFNQIVPSTAERAGNFTDVCTATPADCPIDPNTGLPYPGNQVPIDPNAKGLLNLIPTATTGTGVASTYIASPAQASNFREELGKVDYNVNEKISTSFRYIHDSVNSVAATAMSGWSTIQTSSDSFPTITTKQVVPGISMVARMTYVASPTLLNEFVASYSADHIHLTPQGPWQRPAGSTQTGLFNNGFGGKISGITLSDGNGGYGGGFTEDPVFLPFNNSNPTYTYRDNITKILGNHNLQFGVYYAAVQKNEPNGGSNNGFLSFNTGATAITTGNAFADLLTGKIASFTQTNQNITYYNRYKIFEPYLQDDWHATKRLTLNVGLRISLFGTYREINHSAWNWDPTVYNPAAAAAIDEDGTATGTIGALIPGSGNPFNGLVQCGTKGLPAGCQAGHLFNPAPRFGFAWDPFGDGKTAVRGGYGIFFEHTNGNEGNSESLEGSAPAVLTATQNNIVGPGNTSGYTHIGGSGLLFPLHVIAIPTKAIWPYAQQWHLDVQRDVVKDTVVTLSYVGTKGTHLTKEGDLNQILPLPASQNPYLPTQSQLDCTTVPTGTTLALQHYDIACGFTNAGATDGSGNFTDPNSLRPYPGIGTIAQISPGANSIYNAFQATVRRTSGPLTMDVAYTYSHSIDDSSDRSDNSFVNSYAKNRASSNFDQRHIFSLSYVYDLPFFRAPGLVHSVLGGWQWSGITGVSSGTPFTVTNGIHGDNAGVTNGVGSGSYADLIGNPNAPPAGGRFPGGKMAQQGPLLFNPAAFDPNGPIGLTFGNSGRNSLRNPWRTNFDMALYKNFAVKERLNFEFRAEAFNVFNHTEWMGDSSAGTPIGNSLSNPINANFLRATSAHNPRILQLALKASF